MYTAVTIFLDEYQWLEGCIPVLLFKVNLVISFGDGFALHGVSSRNGAASSMSPAITSVSMIDLFTALRELPVNIFHF